MTTYFGRLMPVKLTRTIKETSADSEFSLISQSKCGPEPGLL